eukprot:1377471-Rhodomonas_salina.2
MEVQGNFLPSSLSLSSMNVFYLVEVNMPALCTLRRLCESRPQGGIGLLHHLLSRAQCRHP